MSGIKKWEYVPRNDVMAAIKGTLIGDLVEHLGSVTDPPLPLEITLPKALALAGCSMAQPNSQSTSFVKKPEAQSLVEVAPASVDSVGIAKAKFRIDTAGGQATNVWTLIAAPSGSGKDIGNLPKRVARAMGIHLGTTGSAEGLADECTLNGAGLLTIGEFAPFLDKNTWQAGAASFLTSAWSDGFFRHNMSQRGKGAKSPRESDYCFPSIIANIQPETLERHFDPIQLESGFLGRFLISVVREQVSVRPATATNDKALDGLLSITGIYRGIEGTYEPPARYLDDVLQDFVNNGARYPCVYNRLVNEYGPRLACFLGVQSDGTLKVGAREWEAAAILVYWFYGMAEALYSGIEGDERSRKREVKFRKFYDFIKSNAPCSKTKLARQYSKHTDQYERQRIIEELIARGLICETEGAKKAEVYECIAAWPES